MALAPNTPMVTDRSVLAALVLTFFFGPLGLFYTSRWWVALGWCVVAALGATITLGFALIGVWPISMIWGAVVASQRHSQHQAWLAGQHAPSQAPL